MPKLAASDARGPEEGSTSGRRTLTNRSSNKSKYNTKNTSRDEAKSCHTGPVVGMIRARVVKQTSNEMSV